MIHFYKGWKCTIACLISFRPPFMRCSFFRLPEVTDRLVSNFTAFWTTNLPIAHRWFVIFSFALVFVPTHHHVRVLAPFSLGNHPALNASLTPSSFVFIASVRTPIPYPLVLVHFHWSVICLICLRRTTGSIGSNWGSDIVRDFTN